MISSIIIPVRIIANEISRSDHWEQLAVFVIEVHVLLMVVIYFVVIEVINLKLSLYAIDVIVVFNGVVMFNVKIV